MFRTAKDCFQEIIIIKRAVKWGHLNVVKMVSLACNEIKSEQLDAWQYKCMDTVIRYVLWRLMQLHCMWLLIQLSVFIEKYSNEISTNASPQNIKKRENLFSISYISLYAKLINLRGKKQSNVRVCRAEC